MAAVTPEMLQAAWRVWRVHYPRLKLGPKAGEQPMPGFLEAIQAALDAAPEPFDAFPLVPFNEETQKPTP